MLRTIQEGRSIESTEILNQLVADSLSTVNKEIYEHNVELASRNRILSDLRKVYDIINTSLGVRDTSQKLIEAIVQEVRIPKGFIALVNKKTKMLSSIAVSTSPAAHQKMMEQHRMPFNTWKVSLKDKEHICMRVIASREHMVTNFLSEVLSPSLDEESAEDIAKGLDIKTTLIYPVVFAKEVIGVVVLCMDKHIGFLSKAEKEILDEMTDVAGIAIERSQIYSDLAKANRDLKKLDQLKDEFVSIASHELRTPMTAIKSYLWMAIHKSPQKLHPDLKRYLDISYNSTERLIHLVNDMLTVSRIERRKVELQMQMIDICEILQAVFDELKIKAEEKSITFTLKTVTNNIYIVGDKDKMREVFQNIIGNALKFTPANGKIAITITKGAAKILIACADTGPGIPTNEMGKLFQKFGRIDYSYQKHGEVGGTGLGLYICKQIVALHKGEIAVQSQVDEGSTFTVILPAVKDLP